MYPLWRSIENQFESNIEENLKANELYPPRPQEHPINNLPNDPLIHHQKPCI